MDMNLGVAVKTQDGPMTAKALILNFSVDLPARAMITNTKQWNGTHGCLYCEDAGVTLGSNHLHRYWPIQITSVSRTHESLLHNAEMATRTGVSVCFLFILCENIKCCFAYRYAV